MYKDVLNPSSIKGSLELPVSPSTSRSSHAPIDLSSFLRIVAYIQHAQKPILKWILQGNHMQADRFGKQRFPQMSLPIPIQMANNMSHSTQ